MTIIPGHLPVRFERKFHLGAYVGSHAQALFRSGRSGYVNGEHLKYGSVVDILFKNVAALATKEAYYPLEVSLATDAQAVEFRRFLACEIGERNLYVLRDGVSVGYVLAGAMYWIDDEGGSTEESSVLIDWPDRSGDLEVMSA